MFDLVWTDEHWTVEEIGKCKCYGGTAEPRPEIVQLAIHSGRHVNKILLETLLRGLECYFALGRQPSEEELNNILAKYKPEPEIKAGVAMEDGFVPEVNQIPF